MARRNVALALGRALTAMPRPPTLPFRTLAPWLRATFGRPVHRVALDAGSTCPNRDGTRGFGGCTYCDVEGSGTGALRTGSDLKQQLAEGIRRVRRRGDDVGVIAYFQSYSNTYVEEGRLGEVLRIVEPYLGDPIVAVSIATRPDCLPDATLAELADLARRIPVWVELGLESADDSILQAINRLHTLAEFEDAVQRAHAAGLLTIGHAILGLPGDGREGARTTADALARARVSGVKVHHLMVLARTQLAAQWKRGEVEPLEPETYVEWLADFVERLHPDQVLHRLTGDSPPEKLLAPRWDVHKNFVRELLSSELAHRGTSQGSHARVS
ncbi:MAG: TIGR01212 family radical SAM protein [Planctomycetota bacterium]|nr:MAG: TIGR01212 family radical SAM protein [Planctomycetota bacterium]